MFGEARALLPRWLARAATDNAFVLDTADDLLHGLAFALLAWAVARLDAAGEAHTAVFEREGVPEGLMHWWRVRDALER